MCLNNESFLFCNSTSEFQEFSHSCGKQIIISISVPSENRDAKLTCTRFLNLEHGFLFIEINQEFSQKKAERILQVNWD